MKHRQVVTIGLVCILILLLSGSPGYGTTMRILTLEGLCAKSSEIVTARVVSTRCYTKHAGQRIYTDVELEVLDAVKGKLKKNEKITLTLYGGTVNGITTVVVGAPRFLDGQESLLFLAERVHPKTGAKKLRVKGLSQGKFNITTDAETGNQMVTREQIPLPLRVSKDGESLSVTNKTAMELADLLGQIRQLAKSTVTDNGKEVQP